MRPEPVPLFPEPLPFARPCIPGFAKGCRVAIADPRARDLQRRGVVVVTLPHFNAVVIAMDDGALVEIAPERVRKVSR